MVRDARRTFRIEPEFAGARVESLLTRLLRLSRAEARALCASGAVRLDGRRVNKGARPAPGSILEVALADEGVVAAEPEQPLDVRLERADLVVVRKPAGMPTVPLRTGESGTLVNALLARYPEMRDFGHAAREPGVVHRLDTQTSGLIVAARSAETFEELSVGLRAGKLHKRYLAVVSGAGLAESGRIEFALAPDPRRYGRVIVVGPEARYRHPSSTRFRVVARGPRFALVEVEAERAFRHQVRVHLAALGHPLVGDRLYGGVAVESLGPRHALHASYVAWAGDRTKAFAVSDEAPRVFLDLLASGTES